MSTYDRFDIDQNHYFAIRRLDSIYAYVKSTTMIEVAHKESSWPFLEIDLDTYTKHDNTFPREWRTVDIKYRVFAPIMNISSRRIGCMRKIWHTLYFIADTHMDAATSYLLLSNFFGDDWWQYDNINIICNIKTNE